MPRYFCTSLLKNATNSVNVFDSSGNYNFKNLHILKNFYPLGAVELRPKVRVRRIRCQDTPKVIKLLKDNFSKSEPLIRALRIPNDNYSPALEELWRSYIDQGMSFIATPTRARNNNLFGAAVNIKLCKWDPDHLLKFSNNIICPKTQDLLGLWAHFIKEADIFERFQESQVFYISNITLDVLKCQDYCSYFKPEQLIAILLQKSFKYAYVKGFNIACLSCVSDQMSRIVRDCGMELIWRYPLKKFFNHKLEPVLNLQNYEYKFVRVYGKIL